MKRRDFELTEKTIKALLQLALFGHTIAESAQFFGISKATLKRRLDEEATEAAFDGRESVLNRLKNAREMPDAEVTESLFRRATGFKLGNTYYPPDTTAAIFWLKNRQPGKWRDVQRTEAVIEGVKPPPNLNIIIEDNGHGKDEDHH